MQHPQSIEKFKAYLKCGILTFYTKHHPRLYEKEGHPRRTKRVSVKHSLMLVPGGRPGPDADSSGPRDYCRPVLEPIHGQPGRRPRLSHRPVPRRCRLQVLAYCCFFFAFLQICSKERRYSFSGVMFCSLHSQGPAHVAAVRA